MENKEEIEVEIGTLVLDIDDTLVYLDGRINHCLVDIANRWKGRVVVSTGRSETRRGKTEELLFDIGLGYSDLRMALPGEVAFEAKRRNQIGLRKGLVFDDNLSCCEMYLKEGWSVLRALG